jgi:serine/threonine protein kinase
MTLTNDVCLSETEAPGAGSMRGCCPCGAPSDEDDVYRRHVDPAEPSADPLAAVPSVAVGEDDFESLRVLGRGTYGKVVQARRRDTGRLYAMKIMRKEDVLMRNQVKHTLTERHVLQSVRHPFIIGLQFAFQTADRLYLVLPFMAGGELFFHLRRERTFSEARVLLYASEILLALQELHRHDIVYRDLKPENVLMDAQAQP